MRPNYDQDTKAKSAQDYNILFKIWQKYHVAKNFPKLCHDNPLTYEPLFSLQKMVLNSTPPFWCQFILNPLFLNLKGRILQK